MGLVSIGWRLPDVIKHHYVIDWNLGEECAFKLDYKVHISHTNVALSPTILSCLSPAALLFTDIILLK